MRISKTKKENNFFIHFHFVLFLLRKGRRERAVRLVPFFVLPSAGLIPSPYDFYDI